MMSCDVLCLHEISCPRAKLEMQISPFSSILGLHSFISRSWKGNKSQERGGLRMVIFGCRTAPNGSPTCELVALDGSPLMGGVGCGP